MLHVYVAMVALVCADTVTTALSTAGGMLQPLTLHSPALAPPQPNLGAPAGQPSQRVHAWLPFTGLYVLRGKAGQQEKKEDDKGQGKKTE